MVATSSLHVILQMPDWGIVDKPPGLSCHNDPGKDLQSQLELKFSKEIHLINRLDQETSGLLLFSLKKELVPELQKALQSPETKKIYRAILRGQLEQSGSWSWPLTDKAEGRKNPQGESAQRKPCLTQVRILVQNQYFTRVECLLETGRQHQIRKHAAISKHAIIGDSRYGDSKFNAKMAQIYKTDRLFLHCQKLMLRFGDKQIVAESPLPAEFNQLLPISQ